ncbi:MAG TPA: type II toxin-antitoxin system VapC family toxin [Roseiarcus sp.]|nr:type II toxin-antitoxin system VapC family toxin [Roseiarcus sp.]
MRVVDTSAWLEWLSDSLLGRRVGLELPQTEAWIVPTIVQYELARCLAREVSEDAADDTIAFSTRCVVTPLDTRIAVQAAEIARDRALSMADAIIYATAIDNGADLLTCDAHFAKLPRVVYFAKGAQ